MTEDQNNPKQYKPRSFRNSLKWEGGRRWLITGESGVTTNGGPPPSLGRLEDHFSPEDLMLASVNSCNLAAFIGFCRRKRFEFISYECSIEGVLEFNGETFEFTRMILRPKIEINSEEDISLVRQYIRRAHELCFMSNSVKAEVIVEPEITVVKEP